MMQGGPRSELKRRLMLTFLLFAIGLFLLRLQSRVSKSSRSLIFMSEEDQPKKLEDLFSPSKSKVQTESRKVNEIKLQEEIYEERNNRVARICSKYGLHRHRSHGLEFNLTVLRRFYIWNGEYNMGYCLQSKTGTTTWMLNYLQLSHLPKTSLQQKGLLINLHYDLLRQEVVLPKDKEHQVIKFLYALPLSLQASELRLLLERAFSFYFVRHPFERLVSAFRDKVLNTDYNHWKEFKLSIRPKESESSIFARFVDALLHDRFNIQWDIHNLPLHLKCDVCNIPYTIIGKQETETEDTAYIKSKLGLTKLNPNLRVHVTNGSHNGSSAMQLMARALSREMMWKLFQHYRIDFELYDYDPIPYLLLAQPS